MMCVFTTHLKGIWRIHSALKQETRGLTREIFVVDPIFPGSWSLSASPKMVWGAGDVWSITLEIPESVVIEYKYAVVDRFGGCVAWQNGNNNVLIVEHRQEAMAVMDNW